MQIHSKPFSTESLTLNHGIWTQNGTNFNLGVSNPIHYDVDFDTARAAKTKLVFPVELILKGAFHVPGGKLFISTNAPVEAPIEAGYPPKELSSITFRYRGLHQRKVKIDVIRLPIRDIKPGHMQENKYDVRFLDTRTWKNSPNLALVSLKRILFSHHIIMVRGREYQGIPFFDIAIDSSNLELFFVALNKFPSFVV